MDEVTFDRVLKYEMNSLHDKRMFDSLQLLDFKHSL